eukprot:CAMPEP_0206264650 /NCGR_PEP_ID=MMETSP0047_2-20121206/29522_1 /ASSEMBLY_ACC=CAM_ASM_000192 /TAXON_ID=195065 /ORGANISM="Chroomonas mesostigmatica_cf, Strain CCMP1168" /LENGTH=41 /DNA_ID= /DNA_START= /DNA_END= /DNA_ORIENTATION=
MSAHDRPSACISSSIASAYSSSEAPAAVLACDLPREGAAGW